MISAMSRLLMFAGMICPLCLVMGCASKGVTQLGGGFLSYESASDARNRLKQAGLGDRWQEQHKKMPQSGSRPPYQFTTLSGPYVLSEIEGHLELVFFDDRLMSTEFATARGQGVITAMRGQHTKVPTQPREEVTLDRRTKFRYDTDPDGTFRFNWRDPKLEDEWLRWVRDNS